MLLHHNNHQHHDHHHQDHHHHRHKLNTGSYACSENSTTADFAKIQGRWVMWIEELLLSTRYTHMLAHWVMMTN